MRAVRLWVGGLFLFAAAPALRGQVAPPPPPAPAPSSAVVTDKEIEVRSGPSVRFYATCKLSQGARVEVVQEVEGGWLAIKPPPGSFSWINDHFIERHGRSAVVLGAKTPVRVGSSLTDIEPTVERVQLERGAQVVIIGEALYKDGIWWPIEPPPQEYRYIPRDAVKMTTAVETVVSASPAPGTPSSVPGAPVPGGDSLFTQAEQAERAGDYSRAVDLYRQQAQQTTDHDLQVRCLNRIQFIQTGNHAALTAPPVDNRLTPVPPSSPTAVYPAPRPAAPSGSQTSGPGRLRRVPFTIDGRPAYALVDSAERLLMYVTAVPGLNLELLMNQAVELYGTLVYRADLRTYYMTAAQVRQLQ